MAEDRQPRSVVMDGDINVIMPNATEAEAVKVQNTMDGRGRFYRDYCKSKGWPTEPDKLTIEQILEIRDQPGWKNPSST